MTTEPTSKAVNLRDISTQLGDKEAALRNCLYATLLEAITGDTPTQSFSVLDIGCGRGEMMQMLREQGHQCVGVDMEPECVRMASQYGETHLGTFDTLESTISDRPFDVVLSSHVLEHVDHPLACLQQAMRVRANRFVFAVPNVLRSIRLVRAIFGNPKADHPTHVYGWTQPELTALMDRAGFDCAEWYQDRVTINPFAGSLGTKLTKILSPIETRLLPRLFPMLSSSLIVGCTKKTPGPQNPQSA
ncbi:class I SAM-dependent methyltransferase [Novipirellula rosea]|uniref:class I SAM-dependent methyltransferase n=1 Tax=Novipirellula rosea TaxID=1031540 RepID=UPI0031E663B8